MYLTPNNYYLNICCIQYKYIEDIIYVQLSEIVEKYSRCKRNHKQKYVDR